MADLFSSATVFLKSADSSQNPERKKGMQDLEKILMDSPFLSKGEKERMARVIPFFSDAVLSDLKETMIRQNLRYFKIKLSA
jgi:hypothetical protein